MKEKWIYYAPFLQREERDRKGRLMAAVTQLHMRSVLITHQL